MPEKNSLIERYSGQWWMMVGFFQDWPSMAIVVLLGFRFLHLLENGVGIDWGNIQLTNGVIDEVE